MKSKNKRLLFLANHYRGPGRAGGARTWHQIKEITKSFEVTLLVPKTDPLTMERLSQRDLPQFSKLKIRLTPCLKGGRKSLFGRVIYQITSALGMFIVAFFGPRPDVVVAMGAPTASALIGLIVAKLWGVKILLDVRDIPIETAEELGLLKPGFVLKTLKIVEAIIFKRVDHSVCVSEEMAQFVRARGVSAERVTVNYIGFDDFSTSTSKGKYSILKSFDFNQKTKLIAFYAGTLATLVDIKTVLETARKLKTDKRFGFVIVGDGERRQLYETYATLENLNIHFTGRLVKEKVHELCSMSDVCLYPLKGGPATGAMLGNKLFDYVGAGKPVLYTGPNGAVPRLINKIGAGCVLCSQDADGMTEILKEILHHPKHFAAMGKIGQAEVMRSMKAIHSARALVTKLNHMLIYDQPDL